MSQHDAKQEAYKRLTEPLPLQNKLPYPTNSIVRFVESEPGLGKESVKSQEQLFKTQDLAYLTNRKAMHMIGQKMEDIFKKYVYKCHDRILTNDNDSFGSCSALPEQKIQPHFIEDLPQQTLQFESRFESGNLAIASSSKNHPHLYYLALQRDFNAASNTTQWFYFKVKNRTNLGQYTFNIVNYVKPYSMFKAGMKVCVQSVIGNRGWERGCTAIEYKKNSIGYGENKNYYTLSFSYNFSEQNNEVYFAYCYPYTYTHLQQFLSNIEVKHADKVRRKVIAKTLGDNVVEMISITNPQHSNKKIMYFAARVHPGQTIGSFVCQSFIQFLLSSQPEAEKLRNQFIIKVIPMLNPDGVINGNYRTSLSGDDLNRQWKNPNKSCHPEVFYAKKSILESEYKKVLFIDFHGHSKKKASFMYGCISQKFPYIAKELPYILSKRSSHFIYFNCNFSTPKNKEGTSRIQMWKAGIQHSYTFQISFCGPQREKRHFNLKDYETMGIELCKNISNYFYSRVCQLEINEDIDEKCAEFYGEEQIYNFGNEDTNGSSSQLEDEIVKEPIELKKVGKAFEREKKKYIEAFISNSKGKYENNLRHRKLSNSIKEPLNIDMSKELPREKKNHQEKDSYLRQRQSLMTTKVNIHQLELNSHIFHNSYYGFATQKMANFRPEHSNSAFFEHKEIISHTERKREKSQPKAEESFGILLPNVMQNQYKKYQRYKKDRRGSISIQERSQSVYLPVHQQKCDSTQTKIFREKSLVQRLKSHTNERK